MTIAIINQKGGTGKTTTTVNLGRALVKRNFRVLIVDFDPQGNLSYSLGINHFENSISEVLKGEVDVRQVLVAREGIDVIPTDQRLSRVQLGQNGADNPFVLKESLKSLGDYDFILIDCPPSLSALTINALSAAGGVLIPMQLDVFSIQGLEQINTTIAEVRLAHNPTLQILGALPVLVDSRKKLTSEIRAYVNEHFDIPVFTQQIRTNVKAAEAPSFGQSVIEYAPGSNSAKDYMDVAQELITLTEKKPR